MRMNIKGFWKTVIWMCLGFGLFYLLTGELKALGYYFAIRTLMYYLYDMIWRKYGKRN